MTLDAAPSLAMTLSALPLAAALSVFVALALGAGREMTIVAALGGSLVAALSLS